jgi:RES domain-containing protein
MRFWRICRQRYAAGAANGEGARLYGGRWNSRGKRVVYASSSLALAAVETFVNLEPNLRPADLVSVEGEIPDTVVVGKLDPKTLPPRWYETRGESLAVSETNGSGGEGAPHCLCHRRLFAASGIYC